MVLQLNFSGIVSISFKALHVIKKPSQKLSFLKIDIIL
jgi:hypothetical protein